MVNHDMEYPDDPGIPIWVRVGSIGTKDHDVGLCSGVDGVLFTTQVICSVVHAKNFVLIELASVELNLSSLCIRKGTVIAIIFML